MRIVGVIQARMGSTRLPGKVLRDLGGRSVLGWVVRAVERSGAVDDLVVATTGQAADDAVVAECRRIGVAWHRGPVDDVLTRFLGALESRPCEAVMRFTADCPLLDPEVIGQAALAYQALPGLDYLTTSLVRTLPRGMDVEIVGRDVLEAVGKVATGYHRTHVTSHIYTHPDDFHLLGLSYRPAAPDLRVTLDTEDDWRLIALMVAAMGDRCARVRELVAWLRARPEACMINAHVEQKALREA
ncbi:glycosyltransferase family protein [Nonomuraea sp. NPDC003804]|uniref:glycosyltransferase family protein n=1 Tax=Nonomuraea sp. NPDC003804 TaxID=3154547 RepID=UPI0033A09697